MRISARLAPAILAAAAALAFTTAGAANAVTPPKPVTAATLMVSRDDSGGNGNWAKDTFTRVLTITQHGAVANTDCSPSAHHCYAFTAALKDEGSFQTIPGAYTPNQGGSNAGKHIHGIVDGTFSGYGDFATFYATAQPAANLVPKVNLADANSSSTWPELAFPHGTAFTGLSENPWGYFYSAGILVPVWVHGHLTYQLEQQQWADTAANGGGQSANAGNITG